MYLNGADPIAIDDEYFNIEDAQPARVTFGLGSNKDEENVE